MKGFIAALVLVLVSTSAYSQTVTIDEVRSWNQLSDVLKHQNVENFEEMEITSFEILFKPYDGVGELFSVYQLGNEFNDQVNIILSKVESGSRIWFDNIKVIGPDKEKKTISMSLKVE